MGSSVELRWRRPDRRRRTGERAAEWRNARGGADGRQSYTCCGRFFLLHFECRRFVQSSIYIIESNTLKTLPLTLSHLALPPVPSGQPATPTRARVRRARRGPTLPPRPNALPRRAGAPPPRPARGPRGLPKHRRGLCVAASSAAGRPPRPAAGHPPSCARSAGVDAGEDGRGSTFSKYCSTFLKYWFNICKILV